MIQASVQRFLFLNASMDQAVAELLLERASEKLDQVPEYGTPI